MGRLAKGVAKLILFLVIALCLLITLVPPFLDQRYYDGARFFNPDGEDTLAPPAGGSRAGFLLGWLTGANKREAWPDAVDVKPSKPDARVAGDRMVATWVGHATLLIQTQGLNILTDPVWSDRAGPFGVGPKRVTAPGVAFDDLPPIDLIVVSHNHYDHMDVETVRRLWERDRPEIVSSLGNDALFRDAGVPVTALDWGKTHPVFRRCGQPLAPAICPQRKVADVIVNRNHHWSSRWFVDRNRALWSSFVITLPGGNIFFAGDTGFGDGKWPVEAASYGPIRLALLPIGAFRFRPGQMDTGSHMGPVQTERAFAASGASYAIAMHWGTFQLSNEARETPPRMLAEVMRCAGYADAGRFVSAEIGVAMEVPPFAPPKPRPAPPTACLSGPAITSLR